ncbi:tetratricopeptide repeat protein [Paremcibacter congregatus]|uniref:Tetratricopeptide repeat protein n=1 Tax=Paremcibacter congregatus TaxID=2043170 RepID=A0A2G4YQV2_9PROT|nr:tetratricopeptide repeat protein [Paremcibacter congregatus]PHZ84704.1 hypothetical protein CRD36_10480 [Paremcibacter congregatus]QDE28899.1 hypothetical protein FIV45_17245 [Paremcibacter congregatus]
MTKFLSMLTLLSVFTITASVAGEKSYQATSLLGEKLYSILPDPDDKDNKLVQDLNAAKAKYDADPMNADNIIWYGRRTAYTGNFRKAITIFSEGIEKHPEDARFYRHRGHRYITIREFDHAIADFEKAVRLMEGTENFMEPDGAPNKYNIPVSSHKGNIWYHLGLAYYLKQDWENALRAYRNGYNTGNNADNLVSTSHWKYMILRRMGKEKEALAELAPIRADMKILENDYYHRLCLFYKGEILEAEMFADKKDSIQNSGASYGQANWYLYNGKKKKAVKMMEDFVSTSKIWGAFGYIAAEADLASFK